MANKGSEGRGILEVSSSQSRRVSSVTKRSVVEAPSTPGRPTFSFSVGNFPRKAFPSKWDDAEKWVASTTNCQDSPGNHHHHHGLKPVEAFKILKQYNEFKPQEAKVFAEKSRVITEEKVSSIKVPLHIDNHHSFVSTDVLLKDKLINEVEPVYRSNFKCSEPMREGFVFANAAETSKRDAITEVFHEVKHKDAGTEMTPIGSSTTSRCHTPFKSSSPARHNTPDNRSGPLGFANMNGVPTIDIKELQDCHLAKLQHGSQFDSVTTTWSSREEEEEDISKSLRHFEMSNDNRKSVSDSRACVWEEEEKNNYCLRYQREEAKIQAWVNLQNAKAEAQSRKLEVKIQKMRLNLEEKLAKRMAVVNRKAEEWRVAAQLQHSEQILKVTVQSQKMMNKQRCCGCFPCNNHHK